MNTWCRVLSCRSSLIYNTSARNELRECNFSATTSDTNATRVRKERHECNKSVTQVLQ